MAFTVILNNTDNQGVVGDLRYVRGTYVNDGGSAGGVINTGLQSVHHVQVTPLGTVAQASTPTFNNTFPTVGGNVTVITTANTSAQFTAYGR